MGKKTNLWIRLIEFEKGNIKYTFSGKKSALAASVSRLVGIFNKNKNTAI